MEVDLTAPVDAFPPPPATTAEKGGAKRRRKSLRDNTQDIQDITKPAIRRLARRGGVKRISGLIYDETSEVLKSAAVPSPSPPSRPSPPQPARKKRKRRSQGAAAPVPQPAAPQTTGTQSAPSTSVAAPPMKPPASSVATQTPPPSPKESLFTLPDVIELLTKLDAAHKAAREQESRGERRIQDPLLKIKIDYLWTSLATRNGSQ